MFTKVKVNSKNCHRENNPIFKQINTNIITDYQKNMYLEELNHNQYNSNICKNKIPTTKNNNMYINGTIDPEYTYNFLQTQRAKFSNNKSNYNTNTNVTNNNTNINKSNRTKPNLNRYNSYGRINTNINNTTCNQNSNKNKYKKGNNINAKNNNNNQKYHKIQSTNNSRGHNNTQINNHRIPMNNNNKKIIPLGNNKYQTIGDTNYSNFGNKLYNEANKTFIQRPEHNTIDLNNLYSNNSNINRKYNMKRNSNYSNNNNNYNNNYNNRQQQYNQKNNNYNFKNVEIGRGGRKNGASLRPRTPDFNKRGKSSSRFNNNNNTNHINNHHQRAKTPDRSRSKSKMKLNLNKEYLNTTDNKTNKRIAHYNYSNRDYNHTIDNASNHTNGKYKYNNQMNRLNTNDYFQMHKKTINNYYDYKDTINNNTITTTNSNSRRYSYGRIQNNNNNQKRSSKKLSKNSSQGNIFGQNNYNINLNSNGINHVYINDTNNNNYNYNYNQYHSNTNLVTPMKYTNQKSNFKGQGVQMTQLRPPNNYNIYDDTFQSFGTNLPTSINNEINKKKYKQNKITNIYNNNNNTINTARNEPKLSNRNYIENINHNNRKEEEKGKDNINIFNEYQKYLIQNNYKENDKDDLNYQMTRQRQKNGNNNSNSNINNTYIPATANVNNMANKTYSFFNNKKENTTKQKENISDNNNNNYNDTNQDHTDKIDIDFNDLDQFSPPYSKDQVNLTNNIDIKVNNNNKYMNIGSIQDNFSNSGKINFNMDFNRQRSDYGSNLYLKNEKMESNRKAINDFILQLKTNF